MLNKMIAFLSRLINGHGQMREMLRYGIIGAICTVLDIGLLNLLILVFHVPVYPAVGISFIIIGLIAFILHSNWTFRIIKRKRVLGILKYFLAAAVGLLINYIVIYLLIESFDWWYNYAKLAAVFVALIWNYGAAKTLIFRK